jgi:hypothetical protein
MSGPPREEEEEEESPARCLLTLASRRAAWRARGVGRLRLQCGEAGARMLGTNFLLPLPEGGVSYRKRSREGLFS